METILQIIAGLIYLIILVIALRDGWVQSMRAQRLERSNRELYKEIQYLRKQIRT